MKKLFFTLCALCLCGTMWGAASTIKNDTNRPDEVISDANNTGLYFYVNSDGNATITYINANSGDEDMDTWSSGYTLTSLTIPEYVSDGTTSYAVTKIGPLAFYNASTIEGEVIFPGFITNIGQNSFFACTGITEVTYEYGETTLSEDNGENNTDFSFGSCAVEKVNLYRNMTVGSTSRFCAPFVWQTTITEVEIGENVTQIPNYMFRNTSNHPLAKVTCYATTPPTWTSGRDPFSNVADGCVLYVHEYAMEVYEGNADWSGVFTNIQPLDEGEVEQPEGTLMDVDTGLFFEIDESTGVVSIIADQESGAYYDANLVAVEGQENTYTLPYYVEDKDGTSGYVTRVDEGAFENSAISGHIVIPATIEYMGAKAFASCTGVTEVTYEYGPSALNEENSTNMSNGSFMSCSGVKTVNLYRDITYLAGAGNQYGPFRGVTSITTVNIGPRVTYIPSYIFRPASGTNNINTINCYAAVPPTLGTIPFSTLPSEYTINVPQGSVETYTTSWTDYSNFAAMSNAYAVNIHNVDADGDGYATFYDSKAVKLYGNAVAYTVSGVEVDAETNSAYVLMHELGDVIPAETGALISGSVAYYTAIEETAVSSETYSGTDYLLGFDEDGQTTVAPNGGDANDYYFYMLTLDSANDAGSLAFYWGNSNGGTFTCSAHKAYLALEKEVVGINNVKLKKGEGDDTTGISSVESATEGASVKGIYTIQGVRVSNMNQPGLYIVDGKKVLVK